jgi:hypothetical protein
MSVNIGFREAVKIGFQSIPKSLIKYTSKIGTKTGVKSAMKTTSKFLYKEILKNDFLFVKNVLKTGSKVHCHKLF